MIKGVNNYVIEISDTGNRYYNRAILFIKPEYTDIQKETLEKEALKLLRNIDTPSSVKNYKRTKYWAILTALAILSGAIGSIIAINVINSL